MGFGTDNIRGLAIAIIRRGNSFLASPGYDNVKKKDFLRFLGGGIDFGESSLVALKREFQEELRAELKNCRLLKVIENIFVYNNEPGHEICFIYEADFSEPALYEQEELAILDTKDGGRAIWVEINEENKEKIVPAEAAALL